MPMVGERIRHLREQQKLSQADIEERTGLLRCYISRVENGHTVPSLETLERFAAGLGIPLYQLFCSDEFTPPTPHLSPRKTLEELAGEEGNAGSEARFLLKLKVSVSRMVDPDRDVLLAFAKRLVSR